MFHRIDQFLCTEYIYVQVMCTLIKVSVENVYKIILTLVIVMSVLFGGLGVDRFIIGDVGMGIAKLLLLNWLTCGIFPIVDIFLCYKRAKRKNFEKLMQAVPAQQPLRS